MSFLLKSLFKSKLAKTAFFLGGSGLMLNYFDNFHQKNVFVRNMNLIFPHYDLPKKGTQQLAQSNKVISKTQLEYIVK